MKKIFLSGLIILALCGCSNTGNISEETSAAGTENASASVSAAYGCVGANLLSEKCGYEKREGTPSEPELRNMPMNVLPETAEGTVAIEEGERSGGNSGEPEILMLF